MRHYWADRTTSINFSDFHLIPPKKIGRLIQVKDQLVVAFVFKMEGRVIEVF
ncbi:hypothetical protein SRABI27_05045 [Pedobacter sp. Bi27]|nr:hypothetical protein SRABI27_05045 [Pedobacter sp. Bi27]